MFYIKIRSEQRTIEAEKGSNLLNVLRDAGIEVSAPCGGGGVCGKCKVKIYGEEEYIVKACETIVESDLELDTMMEEEEVQVLTKGLGNEVVFYPKLRKVWLRVPECPFGKSVSEWTRLVEALKEEMFIRREFQVNLRAASDLKKARLSPVANVWL